MSAQEPPATRSGVLPSWWVLTRDVAMFFLGWVLVFLEIRRPEIRDAVMVFAAGVVGVPALLNGVPAAVQAITGQSATGPASSQPPAPPPSPSSP